jgi:integrase
LQLAKLTSLDVVYLQTEMIKRGDSASEHPKAMTVLRTVLEQAMRLKLVRENVALAVDKPKKPKRRTINPLSVEQARTFLDAARGLRLGALFVLALDAGLRPGESFALHWDCVDLNAGTIRVALSLEEINGKARLKEPKTEKARRTLPIAPRTVGALRAYREKMKAEGRDVEKGLVFVNTEGGWLLQANFYRNVFTPLLKAAKLVGVRPYDLRHTCATLLLAHGVNVKIVSERLGHEDIQTTLKHYAHVLPGMQEQAVRVVTALFGDADVARPPRKCKWGSNRPKTKKASQPKSLTGLELRC